MRARLSLAALLVFATGCAEIAYYAQAAHGQWQLLAARRPLDQALADPAASAALRAGLERAQAMRRFAVAALDLPEGYGAYADLRRPAATWNVVATPELSLEPRRWCYPIAGCLGYRGYFAEADARAEAGRLREQGWDVAVGASPAYSTLGWFDDPLLNTFVAWPAGRLAELMFHELAHRKLFVPGDTAFNEGYATAVGRLGARAWLRAEGSEAERDAYAQDETRRRAFVALVLGTRDALAAVYAAGRPEADQRAAKAEAFARLRRDYAALKAAWGGWSGYDRWFAEDLNNARLAGLGTYQDEAPAFEALFERVAGDFAALHRVAAELAALPEAERRARLAELRAGSSAD